MKFNATSWNERNYKIIAAVAVFIATIGCCSWFLLSKDEKNNAMFFAPILYALILYIIGVITTRVSDKISASLPQKAEIYRNLKRVAELLSVICSPEKGIKCIESNILFIKAFTGHTGDDNIDKKPYIEEKGLKFNPSFLKLAQEYIDLYEEIRKYVEDRIRKYIDTKKIPSKTPYFFINESTIFEPDEWCKETFEKYNEILNLIYSAFEEKKSEFSRLNLMIIDIQKLEENYKQKCNESIYQIETMYGKKLTNYLEQERLHYSDIDSIIDSNKENNDMLRNISQQSKNNYDEISNLSHECYNMKQQIAKLNNIIEDLSMKQ